MDANEQSILARCIESPRSLYAINDAMLHKIQEHTKCMPHKTFYSLLAYNLVARQCPTMPPCVAVFIFFWIADAYRPLRAMVTKVEQHGPYVEFVPDIFDFTHCILTQLLSKNITQRSAPRRAALFYCALARTLLMSDTNLVAETRLGCEKLTKEYKERIIAEWKKNRAAKGRPFV